MEEMFEFPQQTVVLVEDEDMVRRLVSRLLERAGYRVVEAWTGEEGLRILSNGEKVDLLLTDMSLPGELNGLELARRALEKRSDLKLICMSGSGEEELTSDLVARAKHAAFLGKPFSSAQLIETVSGLLAEAS
ncbi:MAG TPA: response regulator [Gaiellaceae bacterium]|jgi:CheY-like chemotaxis protein